MVEVRAGILANLGGRDRHGQAVGVDDDMLGAEPTRDRPLHGVAGSDRDLDPSPGLELHVPNRPLVEWIDHGQSEGSR